MTKQHQVDAREILVRVCSADVLPTWRVFHVSQKKLLALIASFCAVMSLLISFLAIYLLGNYAHFPPIPPDSLHAIIIVLLVFAFATIILSITIWATMKNSILVLTPDGFLHGDSKKLGKVLYIRYQDIKEMYVNGSAVVILLKASSGTKKQVDCRLFDASTKEVALSLIAAYEAFKAHK
jgi:hypothetical protein